jgi:hypothetical protein
MSGRGRFETLPPAIGLLISYFTGYETYHECRVAMEQSQYENGHHGEFCYQMWMSGRWDFEAPDDRDPRP